MLRLHLGDAATAAAKAWSHDAVEPRHVAYAIARHFEDDPEVAPLVARARSGLEPRGNAVSVPRPTDATTGILAGIASRDDAVEALRSVLDDEVTPAAPPSGAPPGMQAQSGEVERATATDAAVESHEPDETVADVLAELDGLVGLASVKQQVRSVVAVVQANRERERAGLPSVNPGLHLVFTGPPGTGKTTVARLVARLYRASGALPGSTFTEVDRADLVAGYVGQTALKTADVIRKTRPGVLFVDEAYALTPSHPSDFGAEAIATLVKAMEDHRDDLAVIAAGYGEEMSEFVESNPGLRSRLKTFIDFPDYAPDELGLIFAKFVEEAGLSLAEGAAERAESLFSRAVDRQDFGNARFARTLFEQAYARMALRAAEDGVVEVEELMELVADDVTWVEPGIDVTRSRIGFDSGAGDDG